MIWEKGAVAEKRNGERGRETTFFSQLSSRFTFVFLKFFLNFLDPTTSEPGTGYTSPSNYSKVENFLVSYEKGREFIANNLLFEVVTESSSCTLGGVVHTVDKKTPQNSPSGRLQEVKNNGKL